MSNSLQLLQSCMDAAENEHLEFKEAKENFHFEKLVKYCVALANERGGKIILGVSDKPPRIVVGTNSFKDIERTKAGIIDRIRLRVEVHELAHPDGRVLVFDVPSRPLGTPIQYDGAYWMRGGEELMPMTPDMLKRIFAETGPDFSAELCSAASITDLEDSSIQEFRRRWHEKAGSTVLSQMPTSQLLADAELVVDGCPTNAALVLFGSRAALRKHLAQAEVIFEYRSSDATGPAQQRIEYNTGFFALYDELWNQINLRNDVQHFQNGLFVYDIPTFNSFAVREAILNAISHRDYRDAGSIFIRQYPRRIEIVSPGGFPVGITPENILWQQAPRNRRLAEAFARCGLVERSGQGMNRIFEECIKESKPKPDFSRSDNNHVWLSLRGELQDKRFLPVLEKIGAQRVKSFATEDFLVLDAVFHDQTVPPIFKDRADSLVDEGILETVTRGRTRKYILSRQFYVLMGKRGTYTRHKGLDRPMNKELLFKHIKDSGTAGVKFDDFFQVLPGFSRSQLQVLLRELKQENRINVVGKTKAARWFPIAT